MATGASRRPCACGGSWVQHQNDTEGCWCRECITGPQEKRCQEYRERARREPPAVERQVAPVRHDAPATSDWAARVARLKSGSRRREVFDLVQIAGPKGLTDDELETLTARSHQSVSATRNTLMVDGLVVDSGIKRRTRYGNLAIAWIIPSVDKVPSVP